MIANLNQWLSAIALAIGIINGLWFWLSRPARDTNKRIDGAEAELKTLSKDVNDRADRHREELKGHDRRIQRVEDELRHLPTRDDIVTLGTKLTAMETELGMVVKMTHRIDDFLRKQS